MAENLNTLYYALGLDDYQMQEGLKKAIQNLSVLDDEFNRINKSIEETFGKKIKNAPIHNEIKGLRAELHGMEKDWNNLTLAERRGAKGQELRAKYEALRKEAGNLNNSLARLYSESQKTASGQKGLAAQFGLVNKELTLQSRLMSNINTLFTTYVSIFAVKSFIQNLARVRGEFENQQIALRAILRNAEAADRIFGQIKSFAVISPFEFKDLVGYAKQLSAFQVPVNELFETTKRLADVSAGLGVGMDRIILAYGQVRSAAVLRGQELRQFTEAGIPLVDELAKKFSELEGRVVSAGDVFEKISNRMVSFEMVKEILEDMTNEGGMFYMMQEKLAESLKGKIANLADAYDIMLNDIGQANDGILKGGVEGIAALMRNWENVWSILKTIIIGYGLYKAAIIAATVAEKAHIALGTSGSFLKTAKNLVFVIQNLRQYRTALEATGMTARSFGAAMGGIIGILAAIGVAIYEVIQNSNKLSNELNKISSDEFSGFRKMADSLEDLSEKLKNTVQGSQEHRDIIRQINNAYGEYLPFILDERTALDAVANSTEQVIEAMKKRKMMMAQEKGEQAIQNEYGSDLAETRKNTLDFLEKFNIAKEDAINIVRILEEKIKQTSGSASIEELYDEVKKYLGEDIFENSAYSITDLDLRLKYLTNTIVNIKNAESDLAAQNSITWGTSFDTKKARLEFEKLEAYYTKLRKELKKEPLDKDQLEQELAKIDKREKIAKINFEVEFEGLSAEKAKEKIKALEEISVKWKEIVKETIGKNKAGFVFKVNKEENQFDYLDRLDKEYKKIKAQQDLIDEGLVTSPETIESTKTQLSLLEQIGKALNYNFKVDKKELKKEDAHRIQLLNKELTLIEKAKDDYDKLIKWQSKGIASQNITSIYGIDFNEKDVEARAKDIISKINSISKTEGEKTQKSFDKWFAVDQTSEIIDNLKKTFNSITKEFDTYKDKFNIYEQILNLGGSEELAINLSGVESGNLVDSIKSKILKSVQEVRPTVRIETILDQKDLPEQVQKLVDAANKAAEDAQKNNLLSAAKLLTMEYPEGMGMAFDLGNTVKEYSVELLKLQNELRDSLNAKGITEEQKKQIQNNVKLAIDANTKIYADKTRKLGAVYVQEQIEIAGLGEAFKNMSTASYESLLKMLEITENAKKDLISGADAISGFKNVGFGDNESQRLATKEPIFAQLFNSEDLLQFQDLLEDIETLLYNEDVSTITTKLGINSDDINKLKLWVSQQKWAAIAVGNTQREINKFRIDRIVKMLGDLSQNLDGAIDGIRNLAGAFGKELDEMTEGSLNLLSTIVSSTTGAISSITSTTQWAGEAMKGASTSAATAIKTVEKASVILAVIGAVLQVATAIAGMFSKDKKLDEEIKASQLRVEKLKNLYSEIERLISRNLGDAQNIDLGLGDVNARLTEVNQQLEDLRAKSQTNIFFKIRYSSNIKELEKEQKKLQAYNEGGTYGLQRQNLIEQQEELIKQRQAEIDKKKTDQSKVADYENQINELDDAIRHFAEDTLKELYNIDLKDWASQIGDALFDAWKKGEDGATAFKNKIGQLMGQVMNEILKIRILEPMMKEVGDKLFGTDGKSGYFGSDFNLTHNELSDIAKTLASAKDKTQKYSEAMNRLEEEINKYGLSMKDVDTESGGLIKEAQNLTEDTGSLLVSYINAIRASVALQEIYMKSIDTNIAGIYQAMGGSPNITTTTTIPPEIIAAISEPFKLNNSLLASIDANMANVHSISANALAQLVMIQSNTYNTAMATRDAVEELRGVISPGHPKGGNGIKVWA